MALSSMGRITDFHSVELGSSPNRVTINEGIIMAKWRVTAYDVQDKKVEDETYNTELAAKTAAEILKKTTKVKQVRVNGKVYKRAR